MVMHARQQVFGGPDQTLCGLPAEGLNTVFGCWNDGVFGEVVALGRGPDEMRATTGFDCPACMAVADSGGTAARDCHGGGTMVSRRQVILDTTQNLVSDFLGSHRDEDECLPRGEIEKAITAGEVSEAEIVATFAEWLRKGLGQ